MSLAVHFQCRFSSFAKHLAKSSIHLNKRNIIIRSHTTQVAAESSPGWEDEAIGPEDSPLEVYNRRIERGQLKNDEHQRIIIGKLQDLHDKLEGFTPKPEKQGFFATLLGPKKQTMAQKDAPRKYSNSPCGLYLYGSVGTGKTMLMDLFHDSVNVEKKLRTHFHQFMLDVHQRIHEVKKSVPKGFIVQRSGPYDPIKPVAQDIAEETWLLCFDEFQVTDIGDAMILKRLFSELWKCGVVIVATSNRPPKDLYKNGLMRINFLPFIPMAEANFEVVNLESGIDYRRQSLAAAGRTYFVSAKCDSKYEMDRIYEDLVSREKAEEGKRVLTVMGRKVHLPRTCGRILDSTFEELCMQPLGAVDYLEICKEFDVLLLRDIPQLDLSRRGEARRFINLIDTVYDHRLRVICSADADPDHLFARGQAAPGDNHHHRMLIGDLDIQKGDDNEMASIFTGEEELFAFDRVSSRLTEMQTEEYWKKREALKSQREKQKEKRDKIKDSKKSKS